MPELRKDPIVGRWVIIANERARRPGNFVETNDVNGEEDPKNCPFCQKNEVPIYSVARKQGSARAPWNVCVIPFKQSFLTTRKALERKNDGLYETIGGLGVHEIVIETPEHLANMADLNEDDIRLVIETYAARLHELEKNRDLQYVLVYKNYGSSAGGRNIKHTRSHIVATPIYPLSVKEKLTGAKKYFQANKRCLFCDLIKQELADKKRIVLETDHFLAFVPFAARFLFETWILPKKHNCDFARGVIGCEEDLARMFKLILLKMKIGLDDRAYNYVIQTAPFRRGQPHSLTWETVEQDYHWHIEFMPHLTRLAGFEKGTGFYINSIPPEDVAEYLREVEVEEKIH